MYSAVPRCVHQGELQAGELASERFSSQTREAGLQLLERQVHQLTAKMADMEAQGRAKLRSTVGAMETKLRDAEDQLEAENRYRCMLGDDDDDSVVMMKVW